MRILDSAAASAARCGEPAPSSAWTRCCGGPRARWRVCSVAAVVCAVSPLLARTAEPGAARVTADKPRAYGYFVGDLVERHVALDLPAGTALDPASLPAVGGRGQALELRSVRVEGHDLRLVYQVFLAPRETRTLELPPIALRATGGPRPMDLRVDAWPVTVAPLLPPEVSPRDGLGELRPDIPPTLIATSAARARLAAYAAVAALLLAWLAHVYLGLPWWNRRQRPFAMAWKLLAAQARTLSEDQRRTAWKAVHSALNRSAGEVVFEAGLERYLAAHTAFIPLRADLQQFFERSRAAFFGPAAAAGDVRHGGHGGDGGDGDVEGSDVEGDDWLRRFCRRCRDAERGSA